MGELRIPNTCQLKMFTTISLLTMVIPMSMLSYNTSVRLEKDLLQNYDLDTRPVKDMSDITLTHLKLNMLMIQEYDETKGILTTSALSELYWTDEMITWNPVGYEYTTFMRIPITKVWYPNILIANPGNKEFYILTDRIRNMFVNYFYNGSAALIAPVVIQSTCNPHMTYYPFDVHHCIIYLTPLGYFKYELFLEASTELNTALITENPTWNVIFGRTEIIYRYPFQLVAVNIVLERRSSFVMINLVIPIIFLVFLNLFVSLIPVESGEKASFSITVFLSLGVFITIIMDNVPPVGTSISFISIMLTVHLANNGFVCVCTILSIYYYYRDPKDFVPTYLEIFTNLMLMRPSSVCRKKRRIGFTSMTKPTQEENFKTTEPRPELPATHDQPTKDKYITWFDVSKAFNRFGFGLCSIITLSEFVATLCTIMNR